MYCITTRINICYFRLDWCMDSFHLPLISLVNWIAVLGLGLKQMYNFLRIFLLSFVWWMPTYIARAYKLHLRAFVFHWILQHVTSCAVEFLLQDQTSTGQEDGKVTEKQIFKTLIYASRYGPYFKNLLYVSVRPVLNNLVIAR
jgi:hypothetical protein